MKMGLETGTPRKGLADIVFERMLRAIKSGAYKPDERLPTEHDLAAEFEVSRPVIREALKRLRDQSLIYSRRGAGSFVRSVGLRNPLGFGQLENVADLLNCYEFRLTLEPAAAIFSAGLIRQDRGSTGANAPNTTLAARSPARCSLRSPPISPGRTRISEGYPRPRRSRSSAPLTRL